jgi:hypothetical protein
MQALPEHTMKTSEMRASAMFFGDCKMMEMIISEI